MKKFLAVMALLIVSLSLRAQTPGCQICLSGSIGVKGSSAILGYAGVIMPADANYTLTAPESSAGFLQVTSTATLTATRNVIAPLNQGQQYVVENNTAGGQNIVLIGPSGTGVTVPNGAVLLVASDGVNYRQPSSNLSSFVFTYGANHHWGDSISQGAGSTLPGDTSSNGVSGAVIGNTGRGFANILNSYFGPGSMNYGHGSDWAEDMSLKLYLNSNPRLSYNKSNSFMIGTNNAANCGTTTACQDTFKRSVMFSAAWPAIPDVGKVLANSSNCSTTGTWGVDSNVPNALYSVTNGSVITCTVVTYSSQLYLGYKGIFGQGGTASVTIDSVAPSTGATINFTSGAVTSNGSDVALQLQRYVGLTPGTHTVTLTVTSATSATNTVDVLWMGGPYPIPANTVAPPVVYVGGVPFQYNDANSSITATYNGFVQSAVATLAGDGLNANFVDVRTCMNTTTSFSGGYIGSNATYYAPSPSTLITLHPGNYGHYQLAQCFAKAMGITNVRANTFGPTLGLATDLAGYVYKQYRPSVILNSDPRDTFRAGMYFDPIYNVTHIEAPVSSPGATIALDTTTTMTNYSSISGALGLPGLYVMGPNIAPDNSQIGVGVGTAKNANNYGGPSFTNTGSGATTNSVCTNMVVGSGALAPGVCSDARGQTSIGQSIPTTTIGFTGKALSVYGDTQSNGDIQAVNMHVGGSGTTNQVCTSANGYCGVTLAGDVTGATGSNTVSAVHATSGTLNGVVIGGTTPAAVTSTALTATSGKRVCVNEGSSGSGGKICQRSDFGVLYFDYCNLAESSCTNMGYITTGGMLNFNSGATFNGFINSPYGVNVAGASLAPISQSFTTSTTLGTTAYVSHVQCNGTITLTLPSSPLTAQQFNIVNTNTSTTCTIASSAGIGNSSTATSVSLTPGSAIQLVFGASGIWRSE